MVDFRLLAGPGVKEKNKQGVVRVLELPRAMVSEPAKL